MTEKAPPKFKDGWTVRDNELNREYSIIRYNCHQLNGEIWYIAKDTATLDHVWIAQGWLTLINKGKKWS